MRAMPQQILIWCCCLMLAQLATALTGDNVCKRTETDTETIEYIVTEPVTFRLYTWCLKIPPRCSKYTTVMKERIKTKLQVNNNTIDFCCDGYIQLETYCVPECNKTECPHMKCDSEKKCSCEAGYYGQRCHRTCRAGFWGENCGKKCVCNGEPCNLFSGDCYPTTSTVNPTALANNKTVSQKQELSNNFVTKSTNNDKIPFQSTAVTILTDQQNKKPVKTDILQEQETELDPTNIPLGISLEAIETTLLPEDEVIIVYPSSQTKSLSSTKAIEKTTYTPTTRTTMMKPTQPTAIITKLPSMLQEKIKRLTTADYYSKMNNLKLNKNRLTDSFTPSSSSELTNINDNANNDKRVNKKNYGSTDLPTIKNINYNKENLLPKNSNGLPPPVPDGSDNSLQLKNNGHQNITYTEENEHNNNNNNIIIKTNEIQRDMEELNNTYSRPNSDPTVNSSLVKAKFNRALDRIDFSSVSIVISITGTAIIFLALAAVMITHCKKSKSDTSSYYDDVKVCHVDSSIPYSGHYASPGGQPIFFCPAFSNTCAFELAQELREAHYDHPRSARCLTNEPLYAELQY